MAIAHRIGLAVMTAAMAAGAAVSLAGAPSPGSADPPDAQLLEFLGSVDPANDPSKSDGGAWLTYLAGVDLGKGAKAAKTSPAKAPAEPKPASAPEDTGKPNG